MAQWVADGADVTKAPEGWVRCSIDGVMIRRPDGTPESEYKDGEGPYD
jgi:hypothetical protein